MTVEQRIEKIERSLRIYRILIVLLIIGGVLWGCDSGSTAALEQRIETVEANTQEIPDVIKARQIQVISKDGSTAIMLSADEEGAGSVSIADGNSQLGILMHADSSGGYVVISNKNGKPVAILDADKRGFGRVRVFYENGNVAVGLAADGVSISDKNGIIGVALGVNKNGGQVAVRSKDGNPVAVLNSASDGGQVGILDKNGKWAVLLDSNEEGGKVSVRDKDGSLVVLLHVSKKCGQASLFGKGKPVAHLSADKDGSGLALFDENGKVIWSAP